MNKTLLPHRIDGSFKIVEVLLPENYDEGEVFILSTAFNSKEKKGETIVVKQKQKGFYELDHNRIRIEGYKTLKETKRKHKELVKEYGRSIHNSK